MVTFLPDVCEVTKGCVRHKFANGSKVSTKCRRKIKLSFRNLKEYVVHNFIMFCIRVVQ